ILYNEDVQNEIIELIQGGGSVYYGTADGAFTIPVLYHYVAGVATRIDTNVVVDGTVNATDAEIKILKKELGDVYTATTATFTGDTWVDGNNIYKGIYDATVVLGTANLQAPIALTGFGSIEKIISIRIMDAGHNIINTATTDVS